tara:strand:+ start:72 stop:869 length:798 start_codon:yes stop_codon:yes gene_type:complete
MNIGIIGVGVVGSACKVGFEHIGHTVKVHDIKLHTKINDVLDTEICYISVPTPTRDDDSCDVRIVESVVTDLVNLNYKGIIAIKSTVVPGTTERLSKLLNRQICFVPEFLRERCAAEDFIYNNNVLVIGADTQEQFEIIKETHGSLPVHIVHSKVIEAELIKYFSNTYKAMRITFANTFHKLCEELGAEYDVVKNSFLFHGLGEGHYLNVNKEFGGFGGMCLPKDTKAMAMLVEKLGLNLSLFRNILDENDKFVVKVPEGMRREI